MARLLFIDVDAKELLAALVHLGERAESLCLEAARDTGGRVQDNARGRVRRATGRTAEAITVEDAPPPLGGVWVYVQDQPGRPSNIDEWIEFGTWKMEARSFLISSARLEETGHMRRIAIAVQDAIDQEGLGS